MGGIVICGALFDPCPTAYVEYAIRATSLT
jgi:hypothetical protein